MFAGVRSQSRQVVHRVSDAGLLAAVKAVDMETADRVVLERPPCVAGGLITTTPTTSINTNNDNGNHDNKCGIGDGLGRYWRLHCD